MNMVDPILVIERFYTLRHRLAITRLPSGRFKLIEHLTTYKDATGGACT